MTERLANDLQDQMQYVTFTREEAVYGINRMQVQAVLREIEVAPVPVSSHNAGGIMNPRGNMSKAIDAQQQSVGMLANLDQPLKEAGFGEISRA